MGYQPNSLAQGLRTGKTRTIGLILGDVSNPFFSKIASCVEKEAARYNYQVMFASSDESSEKFERAGTDVFIKTSGWANCSSDRK